MAFFQDLLNKARQGAADLGFNKHLLEGSTWWDKNGQGSVQQVGKALVTPAGWREAGKGVLKEAVDLGYMADRFNPTSFLMRKAFPQLEQKNQMAKAQWDQWLAPRGNTAEQALNQGFNMSAKIVPYAAAETAVLKGVSAIPKVGRFLESAGALPRISRFATRRLADIGSGQLVSTPEDIQASGGRGQMALQDLALGGFLEGASAATRGLGRVIKGAPTKTPLNISPELNQAIQGTIDTAKKYQPAFQNKWKTFAKDNGLDLEVGPAKEFDSVARKVVEDYGGDVTKMKDMNRLVIKVSDLNNTQELMDKLSTMGKVIEIKPDLNNAGGYKSIKVSMETPTGVRAEEIQITNPEMWKAKTELGGDALYKKIQNKEYNSRWEYAKFINKMRKLYSEADFSANKRLNSSSETSTPLNVARAGRYDLPSGNTVANTLSPSASTLTSKSSSPTLKNLGNTSSSIETPFNTNIAQNEPLVNANGTVMPTSRITKSSRTEIPQPTSAPEAQIVQKNRVVSSPENLPQNEGNVNTQGTLFDVPQGEQRGFLKTVKESEQTAPQTKQNVGYLKQKYQPITNAQALKKADEVMKQGNDAARDVVLSDAPVSAEKSAVAIKLIKKYEAEGNDELLLQVLDDYDQQLRQAGQFVQAASLWNNLSPAGMVRLYKKTADKLGIATEEETKKMILNRMKAIGNMAEKERPQATLDLLSDVAKKLPNTPGEIFESYRYQNMLSNPRTTERNLYQGLFNTLITRPATLLTQSVVDLARHPLNPLAREVAFSDVPLYYKKVFANLPDAYMAFKEAFKGGISNKYDVARTGVSTLESMRRANIPKQYTIIPRFMEAQDKFVSSLIAGGETARLMKHGVDEKTAVSEARKLAEKYLYRNKLGAEAKDKTQSYIVRALDALGGLALEGRKLPVVGKAYSWFVPFVTVPINAAKFMLEQTPANLVGGKITSQKMAQALVGSAVSAVGAVFALQDRTTWAAPTDPKAKELFYASGRKPFSVKVGNSWIPMWYFGPYAISMAVPAAIKQYNEDSREAMTDSAIDKTVKIAGDISNFVISQTPLQGVSSFFRILEGDQDLNFGSLAGFTAGQMIPAEGFVRYINTLIDPVFRKAKTFTDTIKKDIPGLSQSLEPYTNPLGEVSKRNVSDYVAPYSTGQSDQRFEQPYNARMDQLQANAILNQMNKQAKSGGTVPGQEVAPGIRNLPDGRFVAQVGNEFKDFPTLQKAQVAKDTYDFEQTDQKSAIINGTYYFKKDDGSTGHYTEKEFKGKVRDQQLEAAKENKDVSTWLNLAQEKMDEMVQEYKDAEGDPLRQIELQNKIIDLKQNIDKYASYGGFSKPKAAAKAKFSARPKFAKAQKAALAKYNISVPKIAVKRARITGSQLAQGR